MPHDEREGVSWFRLGDEQRNAGAQYNLEVTHTGKGVPPHRQ